MLAPYRTILVLPGALAFSALGLLARLEIARMSLRPRSGEGNGPNLSFDLRRSEYGLPPRFHLDLDADDQAAEGERITALGAKEIDVPQRPADADWRLVASRRPGTGVRGPAPTWSSSTTSGPPSRPAQ